MTYTVIGRCVQTSRLGIGIATYSLGVGGYCPRIKDGVAALSSQAFANPKLRDSVVALLDASKSPMEVLDQLASSDEFFDYRQVGIVTEDGRAACHTGSGTRPWSGHIVDDGLVAMGNVLAGEHVVDAIAKTYRDLEGQDLEERLLQSIEAGWSAGGQGKLNERSAAILVSPMDPSGFGVDLRVDVHEEAVPELRRVWELYRPYVEYYDLRSNRPDETPNQEDWPV